MRGPWLFHLLLVVAMVFAPALPRTIVPIVDPSEEEHKERTETKKDAEQRHDAAALRRVHAPGQRPPARPQIERTPHRHQLLIETVVARAHRVGLSERRLI